MSTLTAHDTADLIRRAGNVAGYMQTLLHCDGRTPPGWVDASVDIRMILNTLLEVAVVDVEVETKEAA
jgi:hypothetical protein